MLSHPRYTRPGLAGFVYQADTHPSSSFTPKISFPPGPIFLQSPLLLIFLSHSTYSRYLEYLAVILIFTYISTATNIGWVLHIASHITTTLTLRAPLSSLAIGYRIKFIW